MWLVPNRLAAARPLVTVVVPVYNAATSLPATVAAVLAQTWEHLEVIAVDDGSTDGSLEVLRGLAAADPRLRVVHQENQGVWAARLAGIENARGEWLAWCDADDLPHPLLVEDLVIAALGTGAEMAVCPYRRVDPAGALLSVESSVALGSPLFPSADPVAFSTINTALWNKAFRANAVRAAVRDVIAPSGVPSPGPRIMEDLVLYAAFLGGVTKVALTDAPRYDYVVRPGSLMTTLRREDAATVAVWLRGVRASLSPEQQPVVDTLAFMHLGVAGLGIAAAQSSAASTRYSRWVRPLLRRDFPRYRMRPRSWNRASLRAVAARLLFDAGVLGTALRAMNRRRETQSA